MKPIQWPNLHSAYWALVFLDNFEPLAIGGPKHVLMVPIGKSVTALASLTEVELCLALVREMFWLIYSLTNSHVAISLHGIVIIFETTHYRLSVLLDWRNWWKSPPWHIWRQPAPLRTLRWRRTTCLGRRCGRSLRTRRTSDCSDLCGGANKIIQRNIKKSVEKSVFLHKIISGWNHNITLVLIKIVLTCVKKEIVYTW